MTTRLDLPTDSVTGRPLYRGLPVPWVTRWTGEKHPRSLKRGHLMGALQQGRLVLGYPDPDPSRHPLGIQAGLRVQRDELGLLWYCDRPERQGVGTPEFAALHAARQRASMLDRRCQVCSRFFDKDEPVTFLESATLQDDDGTHHMNREEEKLFPYTTMTAPCCRICIPVAMTRCPHQRKQQRMIVSATDYSPAYVQGDVYGIDRNGDLALEAPIQKLDISDPILSRTIVKQIAVRIDKYTEEAYIS